MGSVINDTATPISVKVSEKEISSGSLSWQNLELAVRAIHRDGLVVLEGLVEHSKLDFLNEKMCQDALFLQSLGDAGPFNYNRGNIQQDPPMTRKYFEPSIFVNPIVTQVTSSIMGPHPRLTFMSGNTALPCSDTIQPLSQPTHSDADIDHPNCTFALVVNVPLVSMTPENGSTEVWLGTHHLANLAAQEGAHGDRASGRIKTDLLDARRLQRAPGQPTIKKGSIIVRDLRLWHGGKPNLSTDIRVMLAMIHFAPWYRNPMTIEFAEELKPQLEAASAKQQLQIQATYLPESDIEKTYLQKPFGNAYDFDQVDKLDVAI